MRKIILGLLVTLLLPSAKAQESYVAGEVLFKLKKNISVKNLEKFHAILDQFKAEEEQFLLKSSHQKLFKKLYLKQPAQILKKSSKAIAQEELIVKALQQSGLVEFAELNTIQHEIGTIPDDKNYKDQWFHQKLETLSAWDDTMGNSEVVVGVCDSGVDSSHEDLIGQLKLPGYNFVLGNQDTTPGTSHGTMVSGIIASKVNNKVGGAGIAPYVKIMPLKISLNGSATTSDIADCIQYAADNGAKIVNVSFTGIGSSAVNNAAVYARSKNTLVVYAAGNNGNRSSFQDYEAITAVGAITSLNRVASYSNYGTFIDVMAPGSSIYTTTPGNRYSSVDGTSFAAPVTAGVAALIYSINPDFEASQVEDILEQSAISIGKEHYYGYGVVNAKNAVVLALENFNGNRAPIISMTLGKNYGVAPMNTSFDASLSSDPDGEIVKYTWKINGEEFYDAVFNLELFEAGIYNVSLTIEDNKGAVKTQDQIITVLSSDEAKLSVAEIAMGVSYSRKYATASAVVKVVDTKGRPIEKAIVSGYWNGNYKVSGMTDSHGNVTFSSPTWSRTVRFRFSVDDIQKEDFIYLPENNVETEDTIRAKQLFWRRIF